jgi:hypothetical protein
VSAETATLTAKTAIRLDRRADRDRRRYARVAADRRAPRDRRGPIDRLERIVDFVGANVTNPQNVVKSANFDANNRENIMRKCICGRAAGHKGQHRNGLSAQVRPRSNGELPHRTKGDGTVEVTVKISPDWMDQTWAGLSDDLKLRALLEVMGGAVA